MGTISLFCLHVRAQECQPLSAVFIVVRLILVSALSLVGDISSYRLAVGSYFGAPVFWFTCVLPFYFISYEFLVAFNSRLSRQVDLTLQHIQAVLIIMLLG